MAMIKKFVSPDITSTTNTPPNVEEIRAKNLALVTVAPSEEPNVKPAGRDYGAEARGKVTFNAYVAAVTSPGVLSFSASVDEFDKNIEKYAQLIIKKTWEAQNGK
jgi:hypothetical protein